MKKDDFVKLNLDHNRMLNREMREWMEAHADKTFRVERILENSVKLYKVNFWITRDLLIKIVN